MGLINAFNGNIYIVGRKTTRKRGTTSHAWYLTYTVNHDPSNHLIQLFGFFFTRRVNASNHLLIFFFLLIGKKRFS